MRRELFRKAVPSVKLASQPDEQREQHAAAEGRADGQRPRRRDGEDRRRDAAGNRGSGRRTEGSS